MSYILEALKRSQQERELGQTPTLASAAYLNTQQSSSSKLWIGIALLLALIAVLIALYAAFGQRFLNDREAKPSDVAPTEPLRQAAPVEQVQPLATTQEPSKPKPAPAKPTTKARPSETPPSPAAAPTTQKTQDTTKPESAARSELFADIERFKQRVIEDKSLNLNARQEPAQAAEKHAASSTLDTEPSHSARTTAPSFQELSAEMQQRVPEHSISVHVYSNEPKQRFVIMNSSRMREGDTTKDGLNLERILPDGIILGFEGQRFFKKR